MNSKKTFKNFIFFSAGPVGDHAVLIDFANRFFESTGIPSIFLMKHPNSFLKDLSIPYHDHIQHLDFIGKRGMIAMAKLAIRSIFERNCFVLIFPIPAPRYLIVFSYYIRFCTRSRIVGFNLEGSRNFPIGHGYASFLGKKNTIPLLPEMFYESANEMLSFLGYKEIARPPLLEYKFQGGIFETLKIERNNYLVFHVSPSHSFRSLPKDRWNFIVTSLLEKIPGTQIIFTGASNDVSFIEECIEGLPKENLIIAAGKTNAQELLTLYAHAKVDVVVQTGNGLIINMLHVPTVVVDIKGTAMFYYDFNKNATILFSEKGCRCDPFETECTMVPYKGKEYMACMFNIKDEDIIEAIVTTYKKV